ncbi:MAG: hypothetical protein QOD32_3431 [Pyrinomonadaceae bacterium]|jgi:hypothetical protein|nr:hypothetical protein [Pyrinomonadaceae bacterium]
MHDCRQTQDSLIDLLFDEADGAARTRLLAEVGRCAACEAEYRSLAATLDVCGEASAALAPRENYWPQYHAALTRRLRGAAATNDAHAGSVTDDSQAVRVTPAHAPFSHAASTHATFWKRLLTTSIRVPAPLAAAAALLLVATSVATVALVVRPAPEPIGIAAPPAVQPEAAPQIKFVEVPVVEEKIVTQIIYLPRRVDGGSDNARQLASRENLAGVRRQNAPPAANASTATTPRANLSGFKPAGEVNLRIIKGSDAREQ